MEKLGLNEIREKFLSFFESKGHLRLSSASLIPKNDASLLLINSGMAPLKPYFTGAQEPPRKRVTTCQKCIRTPDIERVGKTARHGTFFEMLGNFSFGDYFKIEATAWAWEFITEVLEMPVDKLWVTIYQDDDETFDIWTKRLNVPADRIVRMGKEDNFWEHGTGPCGPCSEIYFDRGVEHACRPDCKLGCECDRYVEFWNLVFTQFDKDENGNYNKLAHPNIDTGMGLERLAAIMQGVDNLFEVDTVRNIMMHICKIANVEYKKDEKTDVSLRVITDHIRSTVMMICDGVIPSNEGRGYVLRRLLRRAARHGKLLNINRPFLHEVAHTVVNESKQAYPELEEKEAYISKIIKIEEERFDETIDNGLAILNDYIADLKANNKKTLDGSMAFKLYDTYGFPIDLTIEIAAENNITVDEDGFEEQMEKQRQAARASRKDGSSWDADAQIEFDTNVKTEFVGYETLCANATVLSINNGNGVCTSLSETEEGIVIFDKTPFYGESGGQVGDVGVIKSDSVTCLVTDTKKTHDGKFMHFVKVTAGEIHKGDEVTLIVDEDKRHSIERNHSSTHLLHKALREVLGSHVAQAGSMVSPERLRFDFSHFEPMTAEQIAKVEDLVNNAILKSMDIDIKVMPIDEAKKLGATALFGEKYGDFVRVVKMGDYSIEFCGGCHLKNTAQAGLFKILSETGIAAGTRRIEAVTGQGVLALMRAKENIISDIAQTLKTTPNDLVQRAVSVVEEIRNSQKSIEQMREKLAGIFSKDVMQSKRKVGDVTVLASYVEGMDNNELRTICDVIKSKDATGSIVAILAGGSGDKISLVGMATPDATKRGVHVGKLISQVAAATGGKGGGKPDMAQGAGKDASKIDDALSKLDDWVLEQLK